MSDHSTRHRYPVDKLVQQLMIIRESRGMKQARIAHLMQTTQTAVSELERGQVDAKVSRVREYAHALGLDLFLGNGGMFPDLEAMSTSDLIDLYYLLGEELQKRITCALNPTPTLQEALHVAE